MQAFLTRQLHLQQSTEARLRALYMGGAVAAPRLALAHAVAAAAAEGFHRATNALSAAARASGAIASSAACFHLGTKTGFGTPSGRHLGARLFFGIGP